MYTYMYMYMYNSLLSCMRTCWPMGTHVANAICNALSWVKLQYVTPACYIIAPRIPPARVMDNGLVVPKSTTRGPLDVP